MVGVILSLLSVGARAAEGMWPLDQAPSLAAQLKADGIDLDPALLADFDGALAGAVVSLGGCTASFVSPEGLLVTNHHCAYRTLQHNSKPERDLLREGFLAKGRQDELPAAPGSYVYVTTAIRDVTTEVTGKLGKKLTDAERARAVERKERELVDACEAAPATRCKVVSVYEKSTFLLVTQRELRDVRLVYAPSTGIGDFGGDIDNWMWPRHTGDFAFLRAYVGKDGQPAAPSADNLPYKPPHWLKVSTEPLKVGDPVMVLGYPGRTYRFETADELAAMRAFSLPEGVRIGEALIAILRERGKADPAVALANEARIPGLANAAKKRQGILEALADGRIEASRRAREARVASYVASDRKLAKAGDPVAAIAAVVAAERKTERRDLVLRWLAPASPMLGEAIALWRMAEERLKPDLEREEGFRLRDQTRFAQARERAQSAMEPGSDRATLRFLLAEAAALPAEQRITPLDQALQSTGKATDAERIEALLDRLYGGTRMHELALRKDLVDATGPELSATNDPMLALAASLLPALADLREQQKASEGAMLRLRPAYMAALRAVSSAPLYPDANGTLRLSWGKVEPLSPRDAVSYAARTTLRGVLEKARPEEPFLVPDALTEAARQIPEAYVDPALGTVPVNFLSTCDITGGNSGSPTLDARGQLIGLAFDTNLEGVGSDHAYDSGVSRAIHVDAAYLRWVMDEVDQADALLEEMGLPHEEQTLGSAQ